MKKLFLIILCVFLCFTDTYASKNNGAWEWIKEFYHNTTSRYNGYFYANLTMMESEVKLEEGEINYDELLSLFPSITSDKKSTVASDMDIIIEKSENVIQKHRRSKWVDNCNYLIGKAYIYLEEYEEAIQHFLYVTSDFYNASDDKSKGKKKKKKRRKKRRKKRKKKKNQNADDKLQVQQILETYHLTHEHSYLEAIQWLLVAFAENKNYQKALIISDLVLADEQLSDKDKKDMLRTQAHIYIRQGNLNDAMYPIKKAILLCKRKKEKAYLMYLLGQIQLELKNTDQAIETFNKLIESKPYYDVEFNAKLKLASAYQQISGGSNSKIKRIVFEMIDDENNIDQLDKLYYTLGNIAVTENDLDQAFNYFDRSIENGMLHSHMHQIGLSYLKKGEVYFFKDEFILASINYDSCITYLEKSYEDYESVYLRQNLLKRIKDNLENINFQDSVQLVAQMSQEEIDDLIQERIEALQQEIEERQKAQLAQLNTTNTANNTFGSSRAKGAWYFYNDNTKKIGYQTFQRTWGKRKLEDNWRRRNKSSVNEDEEEKEKELAADESSLLNADYYLNQIPNTPEKIIASNQSIERSLFLLAIIFKDEMEANSRAIYYFEELLKRFENTQYKDKSYLFLYLIFKEENNIKKANYYLNKLKSEHPDSEVTKAFNSTQDQIDKVLYEKAYKLFDREQYSQCISEANKCLTEYPNSNYTPNLIFIKAKAYGYLKEIDSMVYHLQDIVKNHPKALIKEPAEDILFALSNSKELDNDIFVYRPDDLHFASFILDVEVFQSSNLTVDLSNFNSKVFKRKNYQLVNLGFSDTEKMILIKGFKNADECEKYLLAIEKDSKLKNIMGKLKHEKIVIGKTNYAVLMKSKNLKKYISFYKQYY